MIYNAKNKADKIAAKMLQDKRVSVIVPNFHGVDWHKKVKHFPCFTVFSSPTDYPGKYIVRLFDGTQPTRLITLSDTLEAARKTLPPNYLCVPRSEKDIPQILETWL